MEGLRGLTGHQVVGVLRERYAAEARAHAATLEAVWETVLCGDADSTDRLSDPDEWSTDEVRAALALTRKAADRLAAEAHTAFHRLPELGEAMAAGELDPPRARLIGEWVLELSDKHAHQVCAEVLPQCRLSEQTRLTTGQLIEEIKTKAIALDPEWARRRYEGSLQNRRVIASRTAEGTAKLSGINLPPDRVAASVARLDGLARMAKRAGDPRPIDHLRSDLFLGMTDGTYVALTDDQILQALLASRPADTTPDTPADTPRDTAPEPTPSPQPEPAAEPAPSPAPAPEPAWPGVHLKVRLTTLLGLDRYPAELVGWGPCHAEFARQMVGHLGAAQWRYTFTCPTGHLVRTGLTMARPTGAPRRRASCEAVVEILLPAALIPRLRTGDLAAAVAPDLLRGWGPVLLDLQERLEEKKTQRLLDPRRRAPGAALRREVIAALERCVHPGCRAPAASGDLDHRRDHAKGGDTVAENLNPLCRHDHRVKGEAGWILRRVGDAFEWTTRLGHVYVVPVPPVLPDLPTQDPSPPEADLPVNGDQDAVGEPWERSTAWEGTRPRPDPDEVPPF